jgi:hypothetical protein
MEDTLGAVGFFVALLAFFHISVTCVAIAFKLVHQEPSSTSSVLFSKFENGQFMPSPGMRFTLISKLVKINNTNSNFF